jgi:hypothetical protein
MRKLKTVYVLSLEGVDHQCGFSLAIVAIDFLCCRGGRRFA